jgi:ribosomal protein S27E
MEFYFKGEEKLRNELKQISLEDHNWSLKSWDQDGVGVLKVYCEECCKDIGGGSGGHTKITAPNLFSNFRKSHLMSNGHIHSWCRRKGVDFCNHPQSVAPKGKTVILTAADHKGLIDEGVKVVDGVNQSVFSDPLPFVVVGDPNCVEVKSFWFKVKCTYCGDFFQLCPPKRNLEANLSNHLCGTKHEKALEDAHNAKNTRPALTTGKRGRLAQKSSGVNSNQKDLHAWFRSGENNNQEGESPLLDHSHLLGLMCWGFRGPTCVYAGNTYVVDGLLNDLYFGVNWYPEPHLRQSFQVNNKFVNINGTFRHKECARFSTSGTSLIFVVVFVAEFG